MGLNNRKKLRVPYALAAYGKDEERAVLRVLKDHKTLVGGENTKLFERKIAGLFGKSFGVMVNSGSSANLLAVELLRLPQGSKTVTPVLTFSTTVAPLLQKGLSPVFVDVEPGTYLANLDQVEDSIGAKTKLLMIPNLLGNIPDLFRLQMIANGHSVPYIEDSCDTLGARFDGRPTGAYSSISTTSFYGSHVITAAGGGGMLCVNDAGWARRARLLRGWGRTSAADETESIKKRFGVRLGGVRYDSKFVYEEVGYNLLPLELSAAFGLAQLRKLKDFARARKKNLSTLVEFFTRYKGFFTLPSQLKRVETPWIAFPLTITPDAPFSREDIVTYLENENIQTRPIFSGNILQQPAFKGLAKGFDTDYPVASDVMRNGFLIGCHQSMKREHLDYVRSVFSKFLDRF